MTTKATALKNRIKGVKHAVVDKVSDVLSAPKRAYHGVRAMRANSDANVLREARKYKGAPDFDHKGMPTDAFKVRSVAEGVRDKYKRKNKKK